MLCQKYVLRRELEGPHACCVHISIKILPLYDDECGLTQYDDDSDHIEHDTQGSDNDGSRGYEPPEDSHSHVWVLCREVLQTHS